MCLDDHRCGWWEIKLCDGCNDEDGGRFDSCIGVGVGFGFGGIVLYLFGFGVLGVKWYGMVIGYTLSVA